MEERCTAHTSSPVQNIGHLLHGLPLASPSHALKYGFLTIRGKTGGVSLEVSAATRPKRTEPAAATAKRNRIVTTTIRGGKNRKGRDVPRQAGKRTRCKRSGAQLEMPNAGGSRGDAGYIDDMHRLCRSSAILCRTRRFHANSPDQPLNIHGTGLNRASSPG